LAAAAQNPASAVDGSETEPGTAAPAAAGKTVDGNTHSNAASAAPAQSSGEGSGGKPKDSNTDPSSSSSSRGGGSYSNSDAKTTNNASSDISIKPLVKGKE
jgi:hypothetical protein